MKYNMVYSLIFMNHPHEVITGGHRYNNDLLCYLQDNYKLKVLTLPRCAEIYSSWRKVYAPFVELKIIKIIKRTSVVFFGDTSYKYHLLLLLLLRLLHRGTPVVIIHHFPYLNNRGFTRIINFIWQYVYYGLCKYIIVPSPYTRKMAENLFDKNKIIYIPLPFKKDFVISDVFEERRLLFVGTVERRKGLDYLLDSINIIKVRKPEMKFQLDIVGKIENKQFYKMLIKKAKQYGLDNCMRFWGRVSDEQLEELYKKAEVFTFPSLLEGYGNVLIEAMNHGVPIVAFNNSAMPFTIKNGENGLLANNEDPLAFAEKIMQISGNIELRLELQHGMKETIANVPTPNDFEEGIDAMVKRLKIN